MKAAAKNIQQPIASSFITIKKTPLPELDPKLFRKTVTILPELKVFSPPMSPFRDNLPQSRILTTTTVASPSREASMSPSLTVSTAKITNRYLKSKMQTPGPEYEK